MKAHIMRQPERLTVLEWQLSAGQQAAVAAAADAMGVRRYAVAPAQLGLSVAQLLQAAPPAQGPQPTAEAPAAAALLMDGFSPSRREEFLQRLRTGESIPLKAVTTPTNREWSFARLLVDLQREHAAMARRQAGR